MSRRGGGLDRALRLVGDVRPGEAVSAVLLAANVFLLLAAYYVLKPVREALILAGQGAEVKAYISAGQAVLLVALVPLYGALADRLPRRRLLNVVTAFFVVCLVGFFAFGRAGVPIAIPFFLWIGIFNLMIVAQFWSFANDIYSREQGERLFPIVGVGMSLGSVVGSLLTNRLIPLIGLYLPLLACRGGAGDRDLADQPGGCSGAQAQRGRHSRSILECEASRRNRRVSGPGGG